jgi:hypothetical protein
MSLRSLTPERSYAQVRTRDTAQLLTRLYGARVEIADRLGVSGRARFLTQADAQVNPHWTLRTDSDETLVGSR